MPAAQITEAMRQRLREAVERLEQVLPAQAPLLDFVHHNTLHGFQHLPFEQALEHFEALTGIRGHLPIEEFRRYYREGRIAPADLDAALDRRVELALDTVIARSGERVISRREVVRIDLQYGIEGISVGELCWRLEDAGLLQDFEPDVPEDAKQRLLAAYGDTDRTTPRALHRLWSACLDHLGLSHDPHHPEALSEPSLEQAQALLARFRADTGALESQPDVHGAMRASARRRLQRLLERVGADLSLSGLLRQLSGRDLLDSVRPQLIRYAAAFLDEGQAACPLPGRELGLYAAWRRLPHGEGEAPPNDLPEIAVDAVAWWLLRLGLAEDRWEGYLQRLALELPGWSGMFQWRERHSHYAANALAPSRLMDWLALRLSLDALAARRLCGELWQIEASLPALSGYFERHLSELTVRTALVRGELPEYLAHPAWQLAEGAERHDPPAWRALADMLWTWRNAGVGGSFRVARDGFRLFRLAQHLGLSARDLDRLEAGQGRALLENLNLLSPCQRGLIFLEAYERNYRQRVLSALAHNVGRGRWARRDSRPAAQLVFCMDDREEGIRRHLEERNPDLETLGAAGFFGLPIHWRGLDDSQTTPLCPVVVTPAHEVREEPRPGHGTRLGLHQGGRALLRTLRAILHRRQPRGLWSGAVLLGLMAPLRALALALDGGAPLTTASLERRLRALVSPALPTRLTITATPDDEAPARPERPRLGFTDAEQAERVAGFLRNCGLTHGFAPLLVLLGHGSGSRNNPHLAAYDCGACSGRHGGPNARAFAAMANRPVVRALLAQRGIRIPDDSWFLGAEHDTCDEGILWYDLEDLPGWARPHLERLQGELEAARRLSAQERCRRFASAPPDPEPAAALRHVCTRAADYSQPRPELGHATNASALVGRRSASRGICFDRRMFLISYDPTQDPEGSILEGILLAVGPVGAGINLEYYFSTVNNERLGCGSKVPHNVTGLFGVMEGTASDLRTGLPRQMIEVHEAMRLLLVVEQTPRVLGAICERQAPVRELVGNGWLQLASLHPETGEIQTFERGHGFIPWSDPDGELPAVEHSFDWYRGHTQPLPPARVRSANPSAGNLP